MQREVKEPILKELMWYLCNISIDLTNNKKIELDISTTCYKIHIHIYITLYHNLTTIK